MYYPWIICYNVQELKSTYWFHQSSPLRLLEFQAFLHSVDGKIQPHPHISLHIEYNDKGVSNDSSIWQLSTLGKSLLGRKVEDLK